MSHSGEMKQLKLRMSEPYWKDGEYVVSHMSRSSDPSGEIREVITPWRNVVWALSAYRLARCSFSSCEWKYWVGECENYVAEDEALEHIRRHEKVCRYRTKGRSKTWTTRLVATTDRFDADNEAVKGLLGVISQVRQVAADLPVSPASGFLMRLTDNYAKPCQSTSEPDDEIGICE